MKKLLAMLIGLVMLAGVTLAESYWPIVYGIKGLNLTSQPMNIDPDQFIVLDNFMAETNRASTRIGTISKTLNPSSSTAMPRAGKARGIYQFIYNTITTADSYLITAIATTDYSSLNLMAYKVSGASWITLTSVNTTTAYSVAYGLPMTFASHYDGNRQKDTCYMANGIDFVKWFRDDASNQTDACSLFDVGGSQNTLTGTVTFENSSDIVKGNGTSFLTQAYKGRWIRATPTSPWYEVRMVTSETWLQLRTTFTETTTTTATAQNAGSLSFRPALILLWKDRLWGASFTSPLATGDTTLKCSAVVSSATPTGLEDWSGTDTGFVNVPGFGVNVTGLAAVDDYLFVFKDTNYTVYRYNPSYLPPIEVVKSWNYGCSTPKTIQRVDDNLIYLSNGGVRVTNGFSDVSISDDIANDIKYQNTTGSFAYYYGGTANDNNFPSAVFDEYNRLYYLSFPSSSTTYIYDVDKKAWVGRDKVNVWGAVTNLFTTTTTGLNSIVYLPTGTTNVYKTISTYGQTTATGEIQSADLMFSEPKKTKKINKMELWVHAPAPLITREVATLEVSYYADGVLGRVYTVEAVNTSAGNYNNYVKIPIGINIACNFFRWRLKDVGYSSDIDSTDSLSVVGGNIYYDVLSY